MVRVIGYLGALVVILAALGLGLMAWLQETAPPPRVEAERPEPAAPRIAAPVPEPAVPEPAPPVDTAQEITTPQTVEPQPERAAIAPGPAPKASPPPAQVATRPEPAAVSKPALPRNVTPEGVLPGPDVTAPLTRIPGPPPPETKPSPPPPKRLFLITVQRAGIVRSKGQDVVFAGIVPTPLDQTCRDAAGADHPCGQMAATALKRFIRNRAIDCTYQSPGQEDETATPADCTLGHRNVSEWLVAGGWVRTATDAGEALKTLERQAREAKRGLWLYQDGG